MKIVGTIYFGDVTQKENHLIFGPNSGGMYQFLTNKQTYQKILNKIYIVMLMIMMHNLH